MTNYALGQQLISDLLANPKLFADRRGTYALLQEYFNGLPLDTLRPLLSSNDVRVQRAAAFIASELGRQAHGLVDDVIPLLYSGNRHLTYQAMEVIFLCCIADDAQKFGHVVRVLESDDDVLRSLAMRLVAKASEHQIAAAARFFAPARHVGHEEGLLLLLETDRVGPELVARRLDAVEPLQRRYAAIAVSRSFRAAPGLVHKMTVSEDPDVRKFSKEVSAT